MDQGGPTDTREAYFKEASEEMIRARTLCAKANAVLPDDPLFQSLPLAVLPLTFPDPGRMAYLSRRRGICLPDAAEQFWQFCQKQLAR